MLRRLYVGVWISMLKGKDECGEMCVDNRMCYGDWIKGREGKKCGNWELSADCVRGIG